MTREELMKKKWQGFELIEYTHVRSGKVYECMLLSVDFEQELFKLEPIDKVEYEDCPFWVRAEYCKRPSPRMKKVN